MSLSSYIESIAKKWTEDALLEIVDAGPDKTVGVPMARIKAGWCGRQGALINTLALLVEDGVLEVYVGSMPGIGGRQTKFYRRKA
jgi:hypothetical protein